jgi:hypothetical protein
MTGINYYAMTIIKKLQYRINFITNKFQPFQFKGGNGEVFKLTVFCTAMPVFYSVICYNYVFCF